MTFSYIEHHDSFLPFFAMIIGFISKKRTCLNKRMLHQIPPLEIASMKQALSIAITNNKGLIDEIDTLAYRFFYGHSDEGVTQKCIKFKLNNHLLDNLKLIIERLHSIIICSPSGLHRNKYETRALLFNEMKKILDTRTINGVALNLIFDDFMLMHILGIFELFVRLYANNCKEKLIHGESIISLEGPCGIAYRLHHLRSMVRRLNLTYQNNNIVFLFSLMSEIFYFILHTDTLYTGYYAKPLPYYSNAYYIY